MAHIFDAHHMMFTGDETHHISNHFHPTGHEAHHMNHPSHTHMLGRTLIGLSDGQIRRFTSGAHGIDPTQHQQKLIQDGWMRSLVPVVVAGPVVRHWTHEASGRTLNACTRGGLMGAAAGAAAGGPGGALIGAGSGCAAGIVKEGLRQIGKQLGK